METPITLHSVAHRVSHQIPAESEMSRQNRATPPQIKLSRLSPDPPVTLSSNSQQAEGQGPRGGVSRRAGGGYRGTFGFRKQIALQAGVVATVTPSRYSVQLSTSTDLFQSARTFTSLVAISWGAWNTKTPQTRKIRKNGGGLVFCLLFWLFERQKKSLF